MWVVGVPLAHGVLPWSISLLGARHAWVEGRPGIVNLIGFFPIAGGIVMLVWIMVLHLRRTPERVNLELTPTYLLIRGPYVVTRNPMYVAELSLWLGWAVFYGSLPVAVGVVVLWSLMNFGAIPREERTLEERFGEAYRDYERAVPRWLFFGRGAAKANPRG